MLHILRHSPFHTDITTLLRCVGPGDELLLVQDGVLAALAGTAALELLLEAPILVSVLQEDLAARGLASQLSTHVAQVDYTGFVRLSVKHSQQITW